MNQKLTLITPSESLVRGLWCFEGKIIQLYDAFLYMNIICTS